MDREIYLRWRDIVSEACDRMIEGGELIKKGHYDAGIKLQESATKLQSLANEIQKASEAKETKSES